MPTECPLFFHIVNLTYSDNLRVGCLVPTGLTGCDRDLRIGFSDKQIVYQEISIMAVALKGVKAVTGGIFNIDPRVIQVSTNFNFRIFNIANEDHLTLKRSIAAAGMVTPIEVSFANGVVTVIDGHLRLGAVLALIAEGNDIKSIRCLAEAKDVKPEERTLSLITKNSAIPRTPLETAEILLRLQKFGWSAKDLAEKIGKTDRYVRDLWDMAKADKAIKARIHNGVIAASLVSKLLVKHEPETVKAIVEEAEKIAPKAGLKANKVTDAVVAQAVKNIGPGGRKGAPVSKVKDTPPSLPDMPKTSPVAANTERKPVDLDMSKLRKPQAHRGPFSVADGDKVLGGDGKPFCYGETPQHAVDCAYMLNIASATIQRGSPWVAEVLAKSSIPVATVPVSEPAKPVASVPVAKPAKPVKTAKPTPTPVPVAAKPAKAKSARA